MRLAISPLLVAILGGFAGLAPAWSADLSEAQIREGLQKLSVLIAAEVPPNARWVNVQTQGQRWGVFNPFGEDEFPAKGNAFLLDEKPQVSARVLNVASGMVISLKTEKGAATEDAGSPTVPLQPIEEDAARVYPAAWQDADLTADVAAAVKWLKKEAKKAETATPAPTDFGGGYEDPRSSAAHLQIALTWAVLLEHTGHSSEAMSLAQIALGGADESRRKQMLDGLFEKLAGSAYQRVMGDFGKHHNWTKLRDDLSALVNKFPLGWAQRDAVRVLLHRVTERAKLPAEPPLKTLKPVSEADQKILLKWLKEAAAESYARHGCWTLPPPPAESGEENTASPDPFASTGTHADGKSFPENLGLAAVPLLAALLTDDTLTLAGSEGGYMPQYWGGNSGMDDVATLRMQYHGLPKPPTRAELAWQLLEPVLPSDMRRSDDEDAAERAAEVLAWYASVKDLPPADLALAYMESGLRDAAVTANALTLTDPKKLQKMEGLLLDQADAWNPGQLEPFLAKLGPEKGMAFVARLREKLEADLGRYGERPFGGSQDMKKQMETRLKHLEAAAKGEKRKLDLPTVMAALAKLDDMGSGGDEMDVREAYQALPKMLQAMPVAERVKKILPALPNFKSPTLVANLLSMALTRSDKRGAESIPIEERKKILAETKPDWDRLLAMNANADEEDQTMNLLVQVVLTIEGFAGGKESQAVQYLARFGDRGVAILRQHADLLLDGKEAPPLPSAMSITEEQRKKALEDWSKKPAEEIANEVERLEIMSLIVLNEALVREENLPQGLSAQVWRISQVESPAALEETWKVWKGKPMDKETARALVEQVSATRSASILNVKLTRSAPVFGWRLTVKESPKLKQDWGGIQLRNTAQGIGENLPKMAKRVSTAYLRQGSTNVNWTWFDMPKVQKEAGADEEGVKKEDAEPKKDEAAGEAETAVAEARSQMEGFRREEIWGWKEVEKVLGERRTSACGFFLCTAPVELLIKPEEP